MVAGREVSGAGFLVDTRLRGVVPDRLESTREHGPLFTSTATAIVHPRNCDLIWTGDLLVSIYGLGSIRRLQEYTRLDLHAVVHILYRYRIEGQWAKTPF